MEADWAGADSAVADSAGVDLGAADSAQVAEEMRLEAGDYRLAAGAEGTLAAVGWLLEGCIHQA